MPVALRKERVRMNVDFERLIESLKLDYPRDVEYIEAGRQRLLNEKDLPPDVIESVQSLRRQLELRNPQRPKKRPPHSLGGASRRRRNSR